MVASKLNVGPSSSIDSMLFKFQLVLVVIVNIDVSIVKKFKQTPHLAGCVAGEGGEGYGHQEEEEKLEEDGFGTATSNQILSWMDFCFLIKVFFSYWRRTILVRVELFSIRVELFSIRVELCSIGVELFSIGVELFRLE